MADYQSSYTGPTIDSAIKKILTLDLTDFLNQAKNYTNAEILKVESSIPVEVKKQIDALNANGVKY